MNGRNVNMNLRMMAIILSTSTALPGLRYVVFCFLKLCCCCCFVVMFFCCCIYGVIFMEVRAVRSFRTTIVKSWKSREFSIYSGRCSDQTTFSTKSLLRKCIQGRKRSRFKKYYCFFLTRANFLDLFGPVPRSALIPFHKERITPCFPSVFMRVSDVY